MRYHLAPLVTAIVLFSSGVAWALPPCPSDQNSYYDNCFGTITWADGSKYAGEFRNGNWNGHGTFTFPNGDKYVGEFRNGKRNGQGASIDVDGTKYVGDYRNNKRHGHGTLTFPNGIKYVGEFRNGKGNGHGTFTFPNGDKFVGEFRNGQLNGQGAYTGVNGIKYVGEFKDGIRHGWGTLTFPDAGKIVGEFRNGTPHSHGTFTFANGDRYVGEIRNGKKHGQGTFTSASGEVKEGIWKDNKFQYAQKVTPRVTPRRTPDPAPRRNSDPNRVVSASSGSGFAVSRDGHVITNHHVINGCKSVKIHHKGKTIPANVVTFDPGNDLALLKGNFRPSTVLPLTTRKPELLQDIYVAGYPFGKKISTSVKVTKGIISSLTGIGNNFSNIQIDAALQPGNSGGPILDDRGNVVGVAVARLDKIKVLKNFGSLPENTNFGIKTNVVRNILESSDVSLPGPNRSSIPKSELGRIISDGTYYLSCWMTTAQIAKMGSKKVIFQNLD